MYRVSTITVNAQLLVPMVAPAREAHVMNLVRESLASKPDIILLPELCWCYGTDWRRWPEFAEARDGKHVLAFAGLAKSHSCYIGLPILENRNGKLFNTLLLLNRRGKIVWHYDKCFLTTAEIELGISPGEQFEPFETDFTRIGAAICFDLNFTELAELWHRRKVQLMLFSSMFRGGELLKQWAISGEFFVASAASDEGSQIVTPLGRVLAASGNYAPVISRELPSDFGVFHIDRNNHAWDAIREKYGAEVNLEIHSPEGRFVLETRNKNITIKSIVEQFQLTPLRQYLQAARESNLASTQCLARLLNRAPKD